MKKNKAKFICKIFPMEARDQVRYDNEMIAIARGVNN